MANDRLTGLDTSFLHLEDEAAHMHVAAVMTFEGPPPDHDEVVDGIRCQCGCADSPGYYSLLSCYEGDAMAKSCPICQGQGRLAHRLHKAGKSLDEIRAAIEARYG